jgi:glutathione S-transferase
VKAWPYWATLANMVQKQNCLFARARRGLIGLIRCWRLNTTFFNAYSPLWYALEHSMAEQQQQALVSYGRQSVQHAHSLLEQMLGDKTYLLGNSKTRADAYFIGIVRWNHYHQAVDLQHYPALFRLYQRLEADPAVQFAHAIEQQKTAVSSGAFTGQLTLTEAIRQCRR